ncbi:hypothetical protein [Streptomyces sp. MK37H]|uniref:hypothetical protein n=1 Tax=Streptomyces sp. MK37H TaxID=2699117 RepID=UPI001FFC1F3E|nr:hypothetical protein [Streptomyces sp. MK37H]
MQHGGQRVTDDPQAPLDVSVHGFGEQFGQILGQFLRQFRRRVRVDEEAHHNARPPLVRIGSSPHHHSRLP